MPTYQMGKEAQLKMHIGLALQAMSECETTAYSTEEQFRDWDPTGDLPTEKEREDAKESAQIILDAIYMQVSTLWFNLEGGFYDFQLK